MLTMQTTLEFAAQAIKYFFINNLKVIDNKFHPMIPFATALALNTLLNHEGFNISGLLHINRIINRKFAKEDL